MASPPANRAENAPIRSTLWHKDGSVILQAANTQFRVHWSVLALHSTVFRDMEGLPQPPDEPAIDGCPIVELSDDPNDLEYLLKALYFPAFHCEKKLPLPVVGALIRLGRKYDFSYLLDSAVARVTTHFPTTLEEWDAVRSYQTSESIDWEDHSTLDLIALASDNNILSVLPAAYYVAVDTWTTRTLFQDFESGTLASLNLRRCILGEQQLSLKQFQPGYTLGWARKWEFDDCTDSARCRASREYLMSEYMDGYFIDLAALKTPDDLLDPYDFCVACTQHITNSIAAGRKKIWDELPRIFELPPWSELKNEI
ncbi:hypothetical protein C8R45DRAFT_914198 [Mycena sanguinolenta]|nr:hypothetical protein C8R45DRAFT_914198 [Mycena sanguinolenta]